MARISYCQACHNNKFGVKTRRAVEHTCGLSYEERQRELERELLEAPKRNFNERIN